MNIPDRLQTERLVIRPFQRSDKDAFVQFMTNPAATRFLAFSEEHKTKEGAEAMLNWVIQSYSSNNPVFALCIADRETDNFVGSCGLSPLEEAGDTECYYSLDPNYWKRGYAAEAMSALLDHAFKSMNLDTVVALTHPDNIPARRLAERLGLVQTGTILHPQLNVEAIRFAAQNPNRATNKANSISQPS